MPLDVVILTILPPVALGVCPRWRAAAVTSLRILPLLRCAGRSNATYALTGLFRILPVWPVCIGAAARLARSRSCAPPDLHACAVLPWLTVCRPPDRGRKQPRGGCCLYGFVAL